MNAMDIRKVEVREFIHIIVIFLAAQFAGLFLATQLFNGATIQEIQSTQGAASIQGSLEYAIYVIALIIGFSIVLILISRLYKGMKILYLLEAVVIFSASFFVFAIIISSSLSLLNIPNTDTSQYAILFGSAVLALAMIIVKNLVPRIRNYVTIFISAGVGLIWGYNFTFLMTYILFVVLAVYDVIAVFITKHMVTLANAMIGKNLTFLVQVGDVKAVPERQAAAANSSYVKEMDRLAKSDPITRDVRQSSMVPVPVGNALGTGDIVVPMALAIASYSVTLNFVLSFFIIFGALLGFLLLFLILSRMRRMLPALPPLLFGCSIGIILYYAIYVVL